MLKIALHHVRNRILQNGKRYSTGLSPHPAIEYTNEFIPTLNIIDNSDPIPVYRLLNPDGQLLSTSALPIEKHFAINVYKHMTAVKEIDKLLYECQRQGRISFYLTSYGEEASVIGSAAGLNSDDLVFPQYRESGILLWRGLPIQELINQCFGNKNDTQKSKQMPAHYGSTELHYVTVSSPLATQMPQAVGAAYSYKLAKNGRCVITYFGDGASSEGDAHAALNFAATLECPVLFFCRNNGYAISTPTSQQFRGNGVASRAGGYGMPAIKVDGNDVFAVCHATKVAREYVVENNKPILLEALTYRKGHHSTSDDSSVYRSEEDVCKWDRLDPIVRLKMFLENNMWWNEEMDELWKTDIKNQILNAINKAENTKKPKWQGMFEDVYETLPEHLQEQEKYMEEHLKKFGEHYPMKHFEES